MTDVREFLIHCSQGSVTNGRWMDSNLDDPSWMHGTIHTSHCWCQAKEGISVRMLHLSPRWLNVCWVGRSTGHTHSLTQNARESWSLWVCTSKPTNEWLYRCTVLIAIFSQVLILRF